ncbi:MAG TPA: hypothetical protein VFZ21_04685 [Gemmatimonadaceae bacterium]|jgi:hypothetical protein|nr:hypothetical protein [Gemmatimonadaceae bacterium]
MRRRTLAADRYEELIVNPTLITLTKQRGDIDCGGLEFLVIRVTAREHGIIPPSK